MSALERLAHFQNRRDEAPNQELARDLAAKKDHRGIEELAANLGNPNRSIQADCIKVLYEVGYIHPPLVAGHAATFARLLESRSNRMVWGGMIALGTVARLRPDVVLAHLSLVKKAMDGGSVITKDHGVQVLAQAASAGPKYRRVMFPLLLAHLKSCRPKDVPQHAERALAAVSASNRKEFVGVLTRRLRELSGSGLARVNKVIRKAETL